MNKIIISVLSCMCLIAFNLKAQDTIYLDANLSKVDKNEAFEFYKVEIKSDEDTNLVNVVSYFKSGIQKSQVSYHPYYPLFKRNQIGEDKEWYASGKTKWIANYENGKLHGEVNSFWENGQAKRKDIYKNGDFKKGKTWDENGNEVKHFPFFELASCKGWQSYLEKNLRYSSYAREKEISGIVIAKFNINIDNSISDIEIIKSVHHSLDEEVIRLIKGSPKWNPTKIDGEPILTRNTIPIRFQLD